MKWNLVSINSSKIFQILQRLYSIANQALKYKVSHRLPNKSHLSHVENDELKYKVTGFM